MSGEVRRGTLKFIGSYEALPVMIKGRLHDMPIKDGHVGQLREAIFYNELAHKVGIPMPRVYFSRLTK